jgi:hypothetical protein
MPSFKLVTVNWLPDVIPSGGYEHLWQQPVKESAILIQALTKPGAVIADFTTGTGTVTSGA